MGCNIAYRAFLFKDPAMLDPRIAYFEDRHYALHVLRSHTIGWCDEMIVTHQQKTWEPMAFIRSGSRASDRLILFKDHGDRFGMWGRVLFPRHLVKILIIPATFVGPVRKGLIRSKADLKLLPLLYVQYLFERYCIWRSALRNRVFVV